MSFFSLRCLVQRISCLGLAGLLVSCGPGGPTAAASRGEAPPATQPAEPTVLATVQYYARLLTQAAAPPRDSLLRYRGLRFGPDVFPGRYLLRLRDYSILVRPDGVGALITIEPAAKTALYNPLPSPLNGLPAWHGQLQDYTYPRYVNPALAIQLLPLAATFGPWAGDEYIQTEEPIQPDAHVTGFNYRDPDTGKSCRLYVSLQNAPTAAANVVHEVQLSPNSAAP